MVFILFLIYSFNFLMPKKFVIYIHFKQIFKHLYGSYYDFICELQEYDH